MIYMGLRTWVITWAHIPSSSMEPTLQPGDRVLIRKLHRKNLPRSVQRNDILLFHFPCRNDWKYIEKQSGKFYIKRCLGLPGETLAIRNGFYQIGERQTGAGYLPQQAFLSATPDELLSPEVRRTFPYDSLYDWNIRNFGPLYLPSAGDTLEATETNYRLYGRYIAYETQREITYRDSALYIGSESVSRYVFQKNYYFVAGDRVTDSQDSRYWGLLPEECIVGRAALILYSVAPYTETVTLNRLFKIIRRE